jgi:hypothetical protein
MYCCEPFRRYLENAGKRGLSFLVAKNGGEFFILIQTRGVDAADEGAVKIPRVTVNVAFEVAVKFCPFCGRELKALTTKNPSAFEKLAELHRSFSMAANVST